MKVHSFVSTSLQGLPVHVNSGPEGSRRASDDVSQIRLSLLNGPTDISAASAIGLLPGHVPNAVKFDNEAVVIGSSGKDVSSVRRPRQRRRVFRRSPPRRF